jgi:DnaJ-class molecular chaperone
MSCKVNQNGIVGLSTKPSWEDEDCTACEGCGIVQNKVCKVCNGHGILVRDKITNTLHTYPETIDILKAQQILGAQGVI